MVHKVKKTNGKLELHVTLASMPEAEVNKELCKRVNSQKAKELLVQLVEYFLEHLQGQHIFHVSN